LFTLDDYRAAVVRHPEANFLKISTREINRDALSLIAADPTLVLLIETQNAHAMADIRRAFFSLIEGNILNPVVIFRKHEDIDFDLLRLYASTDIGALLIDGLGDGVMFGARDVERPVNGELLDAIGQYNSVAFGILQAARARISRTE